MTKIVSEIDKDLYTILIVDDVKVNLILLSELLYEYDITTASNGKDALDLAKNKSPDLILLDIVMPDMDGYEVCEELKKNEDTKKIPVVFVTSNADEESIEKAYSVGGIDYVTKPFKTKELLARVKTQIGYADVQKELEEKIKLIDKNVSYSSTDTDGNIIEVSEAFCKISGYTKEELIGKKHSILRHKDMDKNVYEDLWTTITKGKSWLGEVKNNKKDASFFWTDVLITPIFNKIGKIVKYTAIRQDISDHKRVEQLALMDQLTGLYNRRHFNNALPIEINRSRRNGLSLSFIMLDIDYFKQYNDFYGHQRGDDVLSYIGEVLKKELGRSEDLAFRLGGEEFGIIFTSNNAIYSKSKAEDVRKSIMKLNIEHNMSKVSNILTASLGLVTIDFSNEKNKDIWDKEIYKLADDELYKAKAEGRNRVNPLVVY